MGVKLSTSYFFNCLRGSVSVRTVAVIGSGTMGSGIAQVCAQTGWETRLYDAFPDSLQKGMSSIDEFWKSGIRRGKNTEEQVDNIIKNIGVPISNKELFISSYLSLKSIQK